MTKRAELERHLGDVMNTVNHLAQIPQLHLRTMYGLTFLISQFLVHHGKSLYGDDGKSFRSLGSKPLLSYSETILQYILTSCSTVSSPKIRHGFLGCLMNFIDVSPPSFIQDRLNPILAVVMQSFSDSLYVQESGVLCIISLAQNLRGSEVMTIYYDVFMPVLKDLLSQALARGQESLWGQVFECCAIVGESSGKDKFVGDAVDMMNILTFDSVKDYSPELHRHLLKAWVNVARSLGQQFTPYLPMVMEKLLVMVAQDPSQGTGDIDIDNCDERSDILMIEDEEGCWLAVRTAVVEEISAACQLIVLLVEKLQEHFFGYVERVMRVMVPMLRSPHEDIRSYAVALLPEVVRCTAKATAPALEALKVLIDYCVTHLLKSIEAESILELVITGLASMKNIIFYASTDWLPMLQIASLKEPPSLTPENGVDVFSMEQIVAITSTLRLLLKESIQRRGILRAEAQLSGAVDEDDEAEEEVFMSESLELHFNISEVAGMMIRGRGHLYFPVYESHWHEIIVSMIQLHCSKHDQQFGMYILCDVVEFGLTSETSTAFLPQILPLMIELVGSCEAVGPRQAAAYAVGISAEKYPGVFIPYVHTALTALAKSIAMGDIEGNSRGECTDTSVASVGIILEKNSYLGIQLEYDYMWSRWINYLPLRDDIDESKKVSIQLIRLLRSQTFSKVELITTALSILLDVYQSSEISTQEIDKDIETLLRQMRFQSHGSFDEIFILAQRNLTSDKISKMEAALNPVNRDSMTPSQQIQDVHFRP